MKRPSFSGAIFWLAANDDCYWVTDPNGSTSVASCLVADMFGKTDAEVATALHKEMMKQDHPAVHYA